MWPLALLIFIAFLTWYWADSMRSRERAVRFADAACRERDVLLLDQTVRLIRLQIRRSPSGIRMRRTYRFEYTEEDAGRHDGHIVMLGPELEELSMGLPDDV